MEHSHSLVIPPHFDENNYAYRKVRMKAFLNLLMREYGIPLNTNGRSPLLQLVSGKLLRKKTTAFNSKAMNAVFNAASMEEFKRISNVEVAHTTWNILQTVHKGTEAIKINKL